MHRDENLWSGGGGDCIEELLMKGGGEGGIVDLLMKGGRWHRRAAVTDTVD